MGYELTFRSGWDYTSCATESVPYSGAFGESNDVQAFQKSRLRPDCCQALGDASPAARLQRQRDCRGVWHFCDADGQGSAEVSASLAGRRKAWLQRRGLNREEGRSQSDPGCERRHYMDPL